MEKKHKAEAFILTKISKINIMKLLNVIAKHCYIYVRTLSNGLALFVGTDTVEYGAAFAGALISILPMLVLYLIGQRYFVEGTVTSGLKG